MNWTTVVVGAIFFGVVVIIPLIAILTEHQRKMAQILRTGTEEGAGLREDLQALKEDMAELKLALKGYTGEPLPAPEASTLEERLKTEA